MTFNSFAAPGSTDVSDLIEWSVFLDVVRATFDDDSEEITEYKIKLLQKLLRAEVSKPSSETFPDRGVFGSKSKAPVNDSLGAMLDQCFSDDTPKLPVLKQLCQSLVKVIRTSSRPSESDFEEAATEFLSAYLVATAETVAKSLFKSTDEERDSFPAVVFVPSLVASMLRLHRAAEERKRTEAQQKAKRPSVGFDRLGLGTFGSGLPRTFM